MKNKYKKEKRRIFITIMSLLLAVCLIIVGAYSVLAIRHNISNKISYADYKGGQIFTTCSNLFMLLREDYKELNISAFSDDIENEYVMIKSVEGNYSAQTENSLCGTFYSRKHNESAAEPLFYNAVLSYDDLRSSMTDKQYDRILKILHSTPADTQFHYELLCTEFYINEYQTKIIPSKLQIVETKEDYGWYVQDNPVEDFVLNPKCSLKNYSLLKSGEMHRNIIPEDFLTNKYDNSDIKELAQKIMEEGKTDGGFIQRAPFVYAVLVTDTIYRNHYADNPSDKNDTPYVTIINGTTYQNEDIEVYNAVYAYRFNVLDGCLDSIILVSLIIFFFFVVIGFIMEFAILHTFNNRIKQEQKRLEMTNAFAHNMKTPLYVITGFVENLRSNLDTEKKEHYINVIEEQTSSMDSLVHSMLNFSKLDSGEFKLSKTEFNLYELIVFIVNEHSEYSDRKVNVITSDNCININADYELIKLALDNLVENAIKYSAPNSDIEIKLTSNSLSVSNTCDNITQADINKLWQPYFRMDNTKDRGNGLGLSIVKSVLNLHKFKHNAKLESNTITFTFKF